MLPDNMPITEEEKLKFVPAPQEKSAWNAKTFLKNKNLMCCTVGWACVQGAYTGVASITTLILVSKGMSTAAAVTIISFTGIATFVWSNPSGILEAKKNVVVAGVVTAGVLLVADFMQGFTSIAVIAVIATYMYFFCGGAPNNLMYSHIQTLIPPRHFASVNKFYEGLKYALLLIPGYATGILLTATGNNYRLLYIIYGVVCIPGIILIICAGHKELPEPKAKEMA